MLKVQGRRVPWISSATAYLGDAGQVILPLGASVSPSVNQEHYRLHRGCCELVFGECFCNPPVRGAVERHGDFC